MQMSRLQTAYDCVINAIERFMKQHLHLLHHLCLLLLQLTFLFQTNQTNNKRATQKPLASCCFFYLLFFNLLDSIASNWFQSSQMKKKFARVFLLLLLRSLCLPIAKSLLRCLDGFENLRSLNQAPKKHNKSAARNLTLSLVQLSVCQSVLFCLSNLRLLRNSKIFAPSALALCSQI